jgi:hypothetical protein
MGESRPGLFSNFESRFEIRKLAFDGILSLARLEQLAQQEQGLLSFFYCLIHLFRMLGLSPHFWSINHGKREFFSVGSLFLRFLSDRRPRSEPERHSSTEELGSSLSILSSDWHSGER